MQLTAEFLYEFRGASLSFLQNVSPLSAECLSFPRNVLSFAEWLSPSPQNNFVLLRGTSLLCMNIATHIRFVRILLHLGGFVVLSYVRTQMHTPIFPRLRWLHSCSIPSMIPRLYFPFTTLRPFQGHSTTIPFNAIPWIPQRHNCMRARNLCDFLKSGFSTNICDFFYALLPVNSWLWLHEYILVCTRGYQVDLVTIWGKWIVFTQVLEI